MKICLAVVKLLYADIPYKENAKPKTFNFKCAQNDTNGSTGTEDQASYLL